jgi:hypothetical protein
MPWSDANMITVNYKQVRWRKNSGLIAFFPRDVRGMLRDVFVSGAGSYGDVPKDDVCIMSDLSN